jgi:hypothetical protein
MKSLLNLFKMKTKLFTTAFLICSAFAHTLIAQQFNYEVQRNGKAIWSMQITRVQAGQNIEMSLKFKAEVDLLLKEILVEGSENANFLWESTKIICSK